MRNKTANTYALQRVLKQEGISIPFPLYHATNVKFVESILTSGLKARAGGSHNDAYWGNAICLSRNLDFLLKDANFGGGSVILVLDRNELKGKFKTHPYNYYSDINYYGKASENPLMAKNKRFEFEERVTDKKKTPDETLDIRRKGEEGTFCLPKEVVIAPKYIKAIVITQSIYMRNYEYWDELDSHVHVIIRKGSTYKSLDTQDSSNFQYDFRDQDIAELAAFIINNIPNDRIYVDSSNQPDKDKVILGTDDTLFPNNHRELISQLAFIAENDTYPEQAKLFKALDKEFNKHFPNYDMELVDVDFDEFDYADDGSEINTETPRVYLTFLVPEEWTSDLEEFFS